MKTIYKTKDGKEFDTQAEALKHEASLIDVIALRADVKELLSQILIKLKDVEPAQVDSDDDGYYSIVDGDNLVDKYLSCVKSVIQELNSAEYNATTMLTHYYDSSCY